ncbi:MAG: aminopeptidase P family protein, partial [Eubacterium sp.]|nr:aminopeptidase P family protein [Eubacterium sp.]
TKEKSIIVTDSRYYIAAREESPWSEVVLWDKKGYYRPIMDAVKDPAVKTLGYEDRYLTVARFSQFEKKVSRYVKCKPLAGRLDELRQVKNSEEIRRIAEAEAIGDRAYARLMLDLGVSHEKLGRIGEEAFAYHIPTPLDVYKTSERQVAARLEFYMKDEGAEKLSFDTIAASGLNGAKPHAVPTDKLLKNGELLTLDFGCIYQGYCSDMTRTVAIGEVSSELRKIYDIVLDAQLNALKKLRPGMTGAEIDALARDVISDAGYGEYFGHSLGHSVGLKIHETPGFSRKEKTVIRPGMVVSVEPGIYVENVGGVRIEDLIEVTDKGVNDLSASVKELIVIQKEG